MTDRMSDERLKDIRLWGKHGPSCRTSGLRVSEVIWELGAEIDRLRTIERDYRHLLLDHLRVMRDSDGYYHSAGNRTCADILRKLAGLGLFEIVATGLEKGTMGRLTDDGLQMMEEMK